MSIQGNVDGLATVNKFVDTIKFTDYKVNNEEGASGKAFKDVVLQSFSVAPAGEGAASVSYQISMGFEPAIFAQVKDAQANQQAVTLTVPKIISTRSQTEKPANLFAPQPNAEENN